MHTGEFTQKCVLRKREQDRFHRAAVYTTVLLASYDRISAESRYLYSVLKRGLIDQLRLDMTLLCMIGPLYVANFE